MCKKNDYARRIVTAVLVVLTALLALGSVTTAQTTAFDYQKHQTAINLEKSSHSIIFCE